MRARATDNRHRLTAGRSAALVALLSAALMGPGRAGAASASLPGPGGPVDVEAGNLTYDAAADRFVLSDGVRLRRGTVLLRARTASYSPKDGVVDATGDVLLTAPGRVIAADGMHLVLDGPWEARTLSAFYKSKPLELEHAASAAEAAREGRNRLSLWAEKANGPVATGGGQPYTAESVRLTLCDCGEGAPSWEIRAAKAEVTPGKSVVLSWPVIYVTPRFLFIDTPIPVLPLPWLYVPLSRRQTGLLFPFVNDGSRAGWELAEPFFFTMGESWDATLTLGYAFGPSSSQIQGAATAVPGPRDPGVRGVEGSAELRWAPVEGVSGEGKLYYMHDTLAYAWKPPSGDRLAVSLRNQARLGRESFLNVDAALVGDAAYPQDFVADLLLRSAPYLRSALAAGQGFSDGLVEADVSYNLEIGTLGQGGVPVVPFGVLGGSVPSFHRLPALSATLLPLPVVGPLALSGQVGLARFAPISGITDQSVNGIGPGERLWPYQTAAPPPTPLPLPPAGSWTPGERLSATRAWARAELRAPVPIGPFLLLEPWAAGNASGYLFGDGAEPALANAWGAGGAVLSTRLDRVWGPGADALRHVIEPRIEWRGGTPVAGPKLPAYAYDEVDAAPVLANAPCVAPPAGLVGGCLPFRTLSSTIPGGFSQMRLALRNRLVAPSGALSVTRLDLDLGQDLDLSAGKLAETWVRAGAAWGPVTGNLLARFFAFGAASAPGAWAPASPSWLDRFTEVRLDLAAADARGDKLSFGFLALGASASGSMKAGLDPLFDPRAVPLQPFAQVTGGINVRVFGGLDLRWDTLFSVRSTVSYPFGYAYPQPTAPGFQSNTFTAGWTSPCECWRALVKVSLQQNNWWSFGAALDLSEITGMRFAP